MEQVRKNCLPELKNSLLFYGELESIETPNSVLKIEALLAYIIFTAYFILVHKISTGQVHFVFEYQF